MEGLVQTLLDVALLVGFLVAVAGIFFGERAALRELSIAASAVLLILLVGALSIVVIPPGKVGVVAYFGAVQSETLPPGLHLRLPFANNIHQINTRVEAHEFKEIEAASREYQTVKLTGVMNYHLDGSQAADLYQRVGDDFASKILDPAFSDYIKQVVPQYGVSEILAKRDEIRSRSKADLQANLVQYHIIVDDIYIANIAFGDAYTAAIEAKQVAQQQVETERQVLAQKQIQAQQAVAVAQGNADAAVVAAKGQAESNRLIGESVTANVLEYLTITKLAPNVQIALLPAGQDFLIDPRQLLGGSPKASPAP